MKKINLYTKIFSYIDNIQAKKIIEYNIYAENHIYKISISETCDDKINEKVLNHNFINYNEIINILKFLYENSIGISNFEDITEDILHNLK